MTALRPVKSYKHVVDTNGVVTDVVSVSSLILAKDNPLISEVNSVQTASTVHGIFLNVQISLDIPTGGVARFYFIVFKNPGGNLIIPNPAGTGSSNNKKHIIHQEMIMLNNSPPTDASIFPRTFFKGVLKIPRSMKRFGIGDNLQLALITPDVTGQANFCLQCIYKEFR